MTDTQAPADFDSNSFQLRFHTLSGKSATVTTCSSESLQEVSASIEELLGIPSNCQRWLVESNEVSFQQSLTIGDTNLQSGDQITLMHSGFTPLVDLPEAFSLDLTSVRQQFHTGYSSAFTILYKICANTQEGWLYFEPWRKSDHDKYLFDIQAGTVETMTSHWMAGSSKSSDKLGDQDPLNLLRHAWSSLPRQAVQTADHFWLAPGSTVDQVLSAEGQGAKNKDSLKMEMARLKKQIEGADGQTRPDYGAVPGWFVSPSEDCNEIAVDVPLPLGRKKIIRLLIDDKGMPVRAAVKGCYVGHLHQDIEEFKVELSHKTDLSKPSLPN